MRWWWLGLAVVVAVVTLAAISARDVRRDLATAHPLDTTRYVGSSACKHCHPEHTQSFRRTYHRTMTQEASAESVLGAFDRGATVDYFGVRAKMSRGSGGEFSIAFTADGGARQWQARVERTVGSHRYQQYLARDGGVYFRLPIAWDVAAERFIHMNGAFLTPDPLPSTPGGSIGREDYDRHVTRWNDNCVFCHNVRPNPGLDPETGDFDTSVAELGIACEACHGPGGEHVARNRAPLRRYALQAGKRADPTIRNPARMTGSRSAQVCGRCHGQRITPDVGRFLRQGDPFVPGDDLAELSTPLSRETTLHGEAGVFAPRFWGDGTPRLTAYEYQGYLQSPCARGGTFTCESCHAMHQGDPRGQIRPGRAGDAACTQCHRALATPAAQAKHARHDAAGPGARCTSCHMPQVVYGLVSVTLSHRVEVPDPAAAAGASRPDACTLCHVDKPRAWAVQKHAEWFRPGGPASRAPRSAGEASTAPAVTADPALPAITLQLLAGDPIERAVAAHALGHGSVPLSAAEERALLGLLLDAMLEDRYPAVRAIAARSLRRRLQPEHEPLATRLTDFVATDERARREELVRPIFQALGDGVGSRPDAASRRQLRAKADEVAISIGE